MNIRIGATVVAAVLLFGTAGCDKDDGTLGEDAVLPGDSESGTAVSGGSTKGPMQMAEVEVFGFNDAGDGSTGVAIDTGATDDQTNITGLFIPEDTSGLLEFEFRLLLRQEGSTTTTDEQTVVEIDSEVDTTDLTTGQAPILHPFETIVPASLVLGGQRVFATPLSTMTVRIALANAGNADFGGDGTAPVTDAEVLRALTNAQQRVRAMFGYGLIDGIDLLTTPPILLAGETDDPLDQDAVTQYRTAIEALGALSAELAARIDQANGGSTNTSANDVFQALMDDATDGAIDGFDVDGNAIGVYGASGLAAVQDGINTIDPATLPIPNEPNGRTVADTSDIVKSETSATGNDTADDTSVDSGDSQTTESGSSISDIDGDGTPDSEDSDIDGDGVANTSDAFPLDPAEQLDTDDNGIGNNTDTDDDGDGLSDETETASDGSDIDSDSDGIVDRLDTDSDNDGIPDGTESAEDMTGDGFREDLDTDADGIVDRLDTDSDDDGVLDSTEGTDDTNGSGIPDYQDPNNDTDGDGVSNINDDFPEDPTQTTAAVWDEFNWDEAGWQ